MESHIPLQTQAHSKNETAQRRDQEIVVELLPGGSGSTEKQGESYRLPEQENYPIAIRIDLRVAYGRLSSKNQGVTEHEGSVRAEIEKVDKEYRELQTEYSRLTAELGNPSGKGVQQQGPQIGREQRARAAEVKSF